MSEETTRRNPTNGQLPDVSIIFVNWNSDDYLREAVKSVYQQTHSISFEIIVVDNASTAGNIENLRIDFPEICLIRSSENLGFSRANNLGVKHARGKSILFLNPDTKLLNSAVDILFKQARALPDVGVLGCKLLNSDLSVQTSCIQRFPTILNQLLDFEYFRLKWPTVKLWDIGPLFSDAQDPVEVEMISGACMMINRSVFEEVHFYSEDYFMYAEDLDLCYKIRKRGYRNYYIPPAIAIHHGGKSSGEKKAIQWPAIMKCKAICIFLHKTRGGLYAAAYRAAMACSAFFHLVIIGPVISLLKLFNVEAFPSQALEKWVAVLKWAIWLSDSSSRNPWQQNSNRSVRTL